MTRTRALLIVTITVAVAICAVGAWADAAPTLLHSTVLNGVKMDSGTGELYLHNIQASNLPTPSSSSYHPYNPNDGDELWAVVVGSDGTPVARFDFYAQLHRAPWWLLGSHELTDMRTTEPTSGRRIALPDGDYSLDFYLKTGKFYSFPLKVVSVTGASGKSTLLSGDWNDWGYLLYAGADPSQQLVWKVWLRSDVTSQQQGADVGVRVTRDADGKLICTSRPNRTTSLQAEWGRREFDLIHPMQGTSGGAMFYASELLKTDGAYTLKMDIDGQHYGTWRLRVQGGQLVKTGRADPVTADPLRFVDGGADAWWYGREEAGGSAPSVITASYMEVIPGATRITVNGTTLVPMRAIFEWLGAEVKYIPQALSIYASKGDDIIVLIRLDETDATVNGQKVPMGITPQQRDGVTYVPLRFVAETFGAEVGFDAATGAIRAEWPVPD
jgi:hypothetical protein